MFKSTFEDIKFRYNCKPQLWNAEMVKKAVGVYITQEQCNEILGKEV